MKSPDAHPDWAEILDAREGRAPSLDPHLAGCARCRERDREAGELLARLAHARLEDAPESLKRAALNRVRAEARTAALPTGAWAAIRARFAEGLSEVRAGLAADSLAAPGAVRGSTEASPRLLLYETDAYSISISLAAGEPTGTLDLQGQVAPRRADRLPGGGHVVLHRSGGLSEADLSEFGEFSFRGVPRGAVVLAVALGGELIRLGPLGSEGGDAERS